MYYDTADEFFRGAYFSINEILGKMGFGLETNITA
jgi:hypothetical protein